MENAFHCNSDSVVVSVDQFWVVRSAGWVERSSGGQEEFDSFVSEDEQGSDRSEPGWERLVAPGVADPASAARSWDRPFADGNAQELPDRDAGSTALRSRR
jgi:hypothetical protein